MITRATLAALIHTLVAVAAIIFVAASAWAQTSDAAQTDADDSNSRIFGIIPNFRTSPTLVNYMPLDAPTKFHLAREDAFDRGTFILAGLFAGQAQWTQTSPSFGHGAGAYGRYYSAALADLIVGDFMTEAIYPVVLHHDPRYFRLGTGSAWKRLGYAMGQIVWTHTDRGTGAINVSELMGNATAVAIGDAYYPDGRKLSSNAWRWGWQIGTDTASNILKEFWPDLDRAFGPHHGRPGDR